MTANGKILLFADATLKGREASGLETVIRVALGRRNWRVEPRSERVTNILDEDDSRVGHLSCTPYRAGWIFITIIAGERYFYEALSIIAEAARDSHWKEVPSSLPNHIAWQTKEIRESQTLR